uniref:Uncharacterized protein n=1 Tax=virus sp. ctPLL24 TaxID=2826802 RepID=A0A8S5R0U0_9VIRU|nr:MAG TPA: hypothetical protein [virus sp. ctPLL24]
MKRTKKPLTRRPRAEQEHFSGRMLLYTAVMAIKNRPRFPTWTANGK